MRIEKNCQRAESIDDSIPKLTMKRTDWLSANNCDMFFTKKGKPKAWLSTWMDTNCFGTDGSNLINTFKVVLGYNS